jgi:twitching motility protein PilT
VSARHEMNVECRMKNVEGVDGSSGAAAAHAELSTLSIVHSTRLSDLLAASARLGASDLILVPGVAPTIFRSGGWLPLGDRPLGADEVSDIVLAALTEEQRERLQRHRDLDCALALPGLPRQRVNVHYQRGSIAAALRAIPTVVPPFESLNLPEHVLSFADFPHGLVLVTGGTGQGKSTTLASMVNHINRTRPAHVITIEDPIEFEFTHAAAVVEQREIGDDSPSFASALRHTLRQRPDVILIGEMRDLETIATALTAAETGHLVMASLHTATAAQTIARIIDVFPAAQQAHVRVQLAATVRAIVCQRLVKDVLNDALVPACEIMIGTTAVRRAIRENETHLLYSMIETGRRLGMNTQEQSLVELVQNGRVRPEEALAATTDVVRLEKLLGMGSEHE